MNTRLLFSFFIAAAMTSCINDSSISTIGEEPNVPGTNGGNFEVSFGVPNSSNGTRAGSAEDSGIYDEGSEKEYKVSNVTLYLFDSTSKNLVTTIKVDNSDLGAGVATGGNTKDGQTIVYPCNKEIMVKPGTYDVFAVANSSQVLEVGQESTLLGQIDSSTYGNGMIESIPDAGFIMSNRGSANLRVVVESPEESDTRTKVRINLERVVAKLMVRNAKQESYELKDDKNEVYATVRLNDYKFVNLANKFYTFRHVATLNDAAETPKAPGSYTIEAGNFNDIANTNGYLIDPYFFDKTVALSTTGFTGGSFYTNHLSQQKDSNWSGLAKAGDYVSMYCLENCMFRPAQNTVYTTGIMLKGTFTPEASKTFEESGRSVEDPLVYDKLFYFNHKFYTTLRAVNKIGHANIDGLTEESTDKELMAKQIIRFVKSSGNFSTFYNYWIKHLDNKKPANMGVMEFGIVRNNIYSVNITSIKNLGPGTPEITPGPDEYKGYLDVEFGVYPWIVRDQDAELE